ncbi:MAG: OmpA family protein [Paracoccaceae bacterium]|nr:MAG: OmpA family protein [Paracoccaceae bacterium]
MLSLRFSMIALAVAAGLAAPAAAQSADATNATAAELQALFQRQKSRGLKLAPGTGVSASAGVGVTTGVATSVAAVTAPAQGGTVVSAASDAEVLVPVAYAELDAEDQVNIRIAFDFDSAVLRESEATKLSQLCLAMKAVDVAMFRIVGHTDAAGTDTYNDKLSLLRAEEVKRHLVSDCGIDGERLQAVGVGKRYLSNPDDPRGEENRRVEFQALS